MVGNPFTWIKSRGTNLKVEERLDKAFTSYEWRDLFPTVKLTNLIAWHTDHSPILLECGLIYRSCNKHTFKFENSWLQEAKIEEVVTRGLQQGINFDVTSKISYCAKELSR